VGFHWDHYRNDSQYIPLLDYEYVGFRLFGLTGFFEPRNLFFKHAEMQFFLAEHDNRILGRCNAFVNHNHNQYWNDKVGFFGQFESVADPAVVEGLLEAASAWLKARDMDTIRGPQNLPVNEATPGCLTKGFDSRPVMYYHYNKPYYADLLLNCGFRPVKRTFSWEVQVQTPMEEKLDRLAQKVIDRYGLKLETWGERPLKIRKQEMFDIYNDAWSDNWGFVPFSREEFDRVIDDLGFVMDKRLFLFIYIHDEPVAFFGGVFNLAERLLSISWCPRCELLRAGKAVLTRKKATGFRLGYLGVKKKYRHLGLAGVMIWKQKQYAQSAGYEYADLGWVLEDNVSAIKLIEMMDADPSKEYTVFEKAL
jgi:GNAT superfamily N-acetyltransferase